jgi:hypothetical protein
MAHLKTKIVIKYVLLLFFYILWYYIISNVNTFYVFSYFIRYCVLTPQNIHAGLTEEMNEKSNRIAEIYPSV